VRRTSGTKRSALLSCRTVTLPDGHRVGVTTGGHGVPLVFLHGIAMNASVYSRLLSRLAVHGFHVIAIDAAAHGRTAPLVRSDFRSNVELVVRTLDVLGIERAVVLGHSMGGRTAIELSANHPHRLIAAVLVDAAGGDSFDAFSRQAMKAPHVMAVGIAAALYDTAADWWRCGRWRDRRLYGVALAQALTQWSTRPLRLVAAVHAVVRSSPTGELLRQARELGVHVIVVHAENDAVVPWANAVSMAQAAGASLHAVPNAYHSWMMADPRRGAQILASLIHDELPHLFEKTGA
jgi:pimeloyl-ACP methyl ester carboxylesterase